MMRMALFLALLVTALAPAQDRVARATRVRVEGYTFDVELVPDQHKLLAKVRIRFVPDDDAISTIFELHQDLRPLRAVDAAGKTVTIDRLPDGEIRLNFERPLPRGQATSAALDYEGTLESGDNSPVPGLKLAYVGQPTSYLLYAGRWFPVTGYQVNRFTAEFNVTVPAGYRVVAPGRSTGAPKPAPDGKQVFSYLADRASFPGSFAAVREAPVSVRTGGAPVDVYFKDLEKQQAEAYGDAAGRILSFLNTRFGPAPLSGLSLVQIDSGSVNGYAAPGIIFLSSVAIGNKVNHRILAQEIGHQWWRMLVSPASKAHLWLDTGMGAYCELLYTEETAGRAAVEELFKEFAITALANDTVAITRAAQVAEYSPEYDAVLGKKAAVVMHMLRGVIGDEPFFKTLREFPAQFATRPATTDNIREAFEAASGQKLEGFFLQWTESTGAPEFKSEYTLLRTTKGFKIVGKIKQDMDTFRMPVDIRVETDGEPETRRVEVVGVASDFEVEVFGRPRKVIIDPDHRVLKYNPNIRVQVNIARGQQYAEAGEYEAALKEYQKALDLNRNSSLAHFRIAEVFFAQGNLQPAANGFREALNGDRIPAWTEVWSHISLGKIFDISGQRERAVNAYQQALRTRDNTQGAQDEAQQYLKEPYRRERRENQ